MIVHSFAYAAPFGATFAAKDSYKDFWREPDLPFDIATLQTGRETASEFSIAPNNSERSMRGARRRNRRPPNAAAENSADSPIRWRAFVFTSEIYRGQPMRIYALYAAPAGAGPHPAIVSLHGGLDRAQLPRVLAFARAGYACLAFDWLPDNEKSNAAKTPSRTVYAGLDYSDWGRMFSDAGADGKHSLIYRAVIAARRAITWLGQQNEVDANRIGVEGHSWGGYLAQLLAGIDPRVKAVVSSAAAGNWQRRYNETLHHPAPVGTLPRLDETSIADNGVGDVYFTGERDAIVDGHRFGDLSPQEMTAWAQRYDPATFAANIQAPILIRLGAADFFASIDGLADYYPKIRAPKTLQLLPTGNHTFADVETRVRWFNAWLQEAQQNPYPTLENWNLTPNADKSWTVTVPATMSANDVIAGQLAWTTTSGPSVVRQWAQRPLERTKNGAWTATFTPSQGGSAQGGSAQGGSAQGGSAQGGGALRVFVSLQNAAGQIASTLPQVREVKKARAFTKTIVENQISIVRTIVSPFDNPIIWRNAREVGPVTLSPEMIGERSAVLRALWDENALYLQMQVADSTPWQKVRDAATWWNSDSVHLRFWASGTPDFPNAVHLVVWNNGNVPGLIAFHDTSIRRPDFDLRPLTTQVTVGKNNYILNLRLPWKWLDSQFSPRAGENFRMAFLVNDGDLLTNEPILAANWGHANALYKPKVWGVAKLE